MYLRAVGEVGEVGEEGWERELSRDLKGVVRS